MGSRLKSVITSARNTAFHFFYKFFLKPILFLLDPEDVHDWFVGIGKFLGRNSFFRLATKVCFGFSDKSLEQNIAGLHFSNPIGLAAGFDKDAEMLKILPQVGFGFGEVGSVTGYPCVGNPRPRLWRLPKSRGLVVNYGLKNRGVEEIAGRLQKEISRRKFKIPFGTNIAMTNRAENMDTNVVVADYKKSFAALAGVGDFFTVNVSCPNTEGGQPFMQPEKLDLLLAELDKLPTGKPIFVKISPDATLAEVDNILDVLKKHTVVGVVCGNLTKKKNNPFVTETLPLLGGVSGKPAEELANALISHIYRRDGKRFVIIGCGGVFSAEDAYKKIRKGATLVELVTGMIFEGPQLISEINLELVELLRRDGFQNISEAIGADYK